MGIILIFPSQSDILSLQNDFTHKGNMKQTEATGRTDEREAYIIPEQINDSESVKRIAKMMRFILSDDEYDFLLSELNRLKPKEN